MTLPPPRFTSVGLDAYLESAPLLLPLPPGPPESWTCLLHLLGTAPLLYSDDSGYGRVADADLLRALLNELGRPTADEEQEALLLTSPLPMKFLPSRTGKISPSGLQEYVMSTPVIRRVSPAPT